MAAHVPTVTRDHGNGGSDVTLIDTRQAIRAMAACLMMAALLAGCSTSNTKPPSRTKAPASTTRSTTAPPTSADRGLIYVALGDSWSHGTHCGGCRTFASRYGDGLPRIAGRPVTFADQTKNGGGTDSMLSDVRSDGVLRHVIESADIIMIATGLNDLVVDGLVDKLRAGTCGGTDGADCLRAAGAAWRSNFAAIMVEISNLRHPKPTAIRLLVEPNVFLSDPSLVKGSGLPADFPLKGGALTISLLRDALCDTATKHHAICVDAGRILNGPKLDQPRDENTPAAHQAVADALLATGLPELD